MSERAPSSPQPSGPAPRPPGTIRLGQIAGADVLVNASWFLIAALISVLVAPRVEQVEPGLGVWKYGAGFAFAVILYASVLLHEASHAYVARRFGHRVSSITLHFLGGMTAIDGEARTAKQEFWIAVVGPLTSLAVGGAAVAAWFVTPEGLLQVGVEGLAGANLLIGVLNLVPALPLDGGRVLKASVWQLTGNMHRGTSIAGWSGRLLAVVVLGWPFYQQALLGTPPLVVDYVLAAVLAAFLWTGATAAILNARIRSRLPSLVARRLARRTVTVPEDTPLGQAVATAQSHRAGSIVTVDAGGHPVGIVSERALLAVPADRRPWMPTSSVARTLGPGMTLPVDLAGEELVAAIARRPAEEYLLVAPDGTLHGVLSTVDVDRAFNDRGN
ncbi:site-2 protease family protein [Nocardioides jishulii]|uniref:Zinc metalloprotease n=1 Tax=Nocardioides jishulii TaxID=2575440 RepID=A0A4U2YNX8_9ACTN|nr:site-2 protease family protein [Nocardioides jishulii]QCX27545.1 CBS domain-containing protein [Nocardioides jishulii]TKI62352.1 CBS domain-containing protein [Nocardioides jishulii]